MATQPVFQIYAELDGYKPSIWRRFQVAGNISVARLGYILMTLFEMNASHLFCFEQIKDEIPSGLPEAGRPKRRKRITAMDIIRYDIVHQLNNPIKYADKYYYGLQYRFTKKSNRVYRQRSHSARSGEGVWYQS